MTCRIAKERHRAPANLDAYLGQIPDDALLSAQEERALAEAIHRGDATARARLIRANLRLVIRIARDYLGRGLALEDLVGEGNLGLIRAAEEFDPRFGTRFSTYAAYWIRQAIRHALINTTSTIRLPAHMIGLLTRWRRVERALSRAEEAPPAADRVATALGLTEAQRGLVEHAFRARRLYREGGETGGGSAEEAPDPHDGPEADLVSGEDCRELRRRLGRLDPRERTILTLRFGLNGQPPLTLKEVGRRLGVTREWVRKIEIKALHKLDDDADAELPTVRARGPVRSSRPRASTAPFPDHLSPSQAV